MSLHRDGRNARPSACAEVKILKDSRRTVLARCTAPAKPLASSNPSAFRGITSHVGQMTTARAPRHPIPIGRQVVYRLNTRIDRPVGCFAIPTVVSVSRTSGLHVIRYTFASTRWNRRPLHVLRKRWNPRRVRIAELRTGRLHVNPARSGEQGHGKIALDRWFAGTAWVLLGDPLMYRLSAGRVPDTSISDHDCRAREVRSAR